ncbi:amidohydrolase family protein [Bradyrhizobium sp. RD5-C2]|uniref:amidohydrolase family protein n=1 Tax=Bradyrhizobium sp. RD5-C2 TaxID=244562 RepID=UPI001CC7DFB0|nr:amidohydrolase family protein [Bradyrhizobium sp. RD5-C2]GIQ78877.1 amidohydrolase [Bradyrhizobium sp. RD5-C2]
MSSRIRKIALEEHFTAPGFEEYSKVFTKHMDSAAQSKLSSQLRDFEDLRLGEMDRAGIDKVVLSQTGPGVQGETNVNVAIRRAAEGNDYLAQQIQRHPARYAGFASLPMHSPKAAASELTRAVEVLGFKGALVNGHTGGIYYDDPAYDAFWERMQHLDVPLYLHPTDPSPVPKAYDGHPELTGAVWGWGVETATHALRLLFGGIFDRFPRLKIILGHMGEGLPMLLWRFDSRFAVYPHGVRLAHKPSEYFGGNIFITTSGVCSSAALACALAEMGNDAVMFSVDYPYESTAIAADFIERAPISEDVRVQVCSRNAERILKLA